jgi:hypothetical protein
VRPWLSELDAPEWQELAGGRLGRRRMSKGIRTRTWPRKAPHTSGMGEHGSDFPKKTKKDAKAGECL